MTIAMNPELKERIAQIVEGMVLRDLPKDEVFERLTINRITGDAALEMYQNAFRKRVKAIRVKLVMKALRNLLWLIPVYGFIGLQWSIFHKLGGRAGGSGILLLLILMITNVFFTPAFIGLWRIINPLLWAIFAVHKKGSFDDDEA
jgi:hypothetical protein